MKIGILTSGGDCAGLNAVMRAIGLNAYRNIKNCEIVGIPDGYAFPMTVPLSFGEAVALELGPMRLR